MMLLFPERAFLRQAGLFVIVSVFLLMCSVAMGEETIEEAIIEQVAGTDENEIRQQVSLEGILGSKAVVSINGKRQLLSTGQQQDGVKVIKIHPNSIEVTIDGKRRHLRMGDHHVVAAPYKQKKFSTVIVAPDARGMYVTVGSINGLPVSFLVDTGATTVAMNATQAKRLGIDFRIVGQPTMVGTASGVAKAYGVTLDKVAVGSIVLRNVAAVVMEGRFPTQTLLGMSFLGQLELQREGAVMRIKKKY